MMNAVTGISRRSRRTAACWLVAASLVLPGSLLVAGSAAAPEDEDPTEARLEGFQGDLKVENDSTALAWLFLIFLTVVALSPLFKDAKRTHLD